jgi:hypothetical protein
LFFSSGRFLSTGSNLVYIWRFADRSSLMVGLPTSHARLKNYLKNEGLTP